ncbi:MAG: hypothetical protein QHG98_01440 [Methanothrix sp.]|jgi:hypothetical protein|uniref:hypothetical protein n=1 Tax=Methanothrix sp. TaxID=90426 RepID=UPI00247D527E|nr:hypothetical protein [Methanothrix sp.]
MKGIIAVLAVMLALVSVGAAWDVSCDYNVVQQSNKADVNAYDKQIIEQTQDNCAMILGEGNSLIQSNYATSAPTAFKTVKQTQSNVAMIVGKSNYATQSNIAVADCIPAGTLTQTQKNSLLIIGSNNYASQSNYANADNSLDVPATVTQTQTNLGVMLGKKNALTQSSVATASTPDNKWTYDAPVVKQSQRNIAFMVNNCGDCRYDPETSYYGTTQVTWPTLVVNKPTAIEVACPNCELDP